MTNNTTSHTAIRIHIQKKEIYWEFVGSKGLSIEILENGSINRDDNLKTLATIYTYFSLIIAATKPEWAVIFHRKRPWQHQIEGIIRLICARENIKFI